MSDDAKQQTVELPAMLESASAFPGAEAKAKETAGVNGSDVDNSATASAQAVATKVSAIVENSEPSNTNSKRTSADSAMDAKPADVPQDTEMKDISIKDNDLSPPTGESADLAADTLASESKSKAPRRKSSGVPEHKKKLNKKASKSKMIHSDAQPGDYFFVRLKGYPLWPAIVCDESMLPTTLIKSRPVSAAGPEGAYRADYEDGGPKVKDRSFPVMYLHTNEFGWIPNYDLIDLNIEDVSDPPASMRKDLAAAYQLATEKHDLDHFKVILKEFMESRAAAQAAKEAAKDAAKAAKKAKKEKRVSKAVVEDEGDEDVEMPDAPADVNSEDPDVTIDEKPLKATKKRKIPEGDAETPQRSESVKKPKIKLNTPKTTNGASTPKSAKEPSTVKASKPKVKKSTTKVTESPEPVAPKEPKLTAEEKRLKKEKEILFLRHKLQKGLLTREQDPKEEEMKHMSEFVTKLEGYADLEVSIIRATKINKVLKAILKMSTIPREEEFQFKPRSQTLLDKWNKLLASEQGTPAATSTTNGVGSESKTEIDDTKPSPTDTTNGLKESTEENKNVSKAAENAGEPKDKPATKEPASSTLEEAVEKKTIAEPAPVESTA